MSETDVCEKPLSKHLQHHQLQQHNHRHHHNHNHHTKSAALGAPSSSSSSSFLQYGSEKPPPIVVVVGDGRSRVRRVVRTATRHVTVVSYSTRHKETRTHHVTTATVSFPQKAIDRNGSAQYVNVSGGGGGGGGVGVVGAPPGSITSVSSMSTDGGVGVVGGGSGGYVYLQQHYVPSSVSSGSASSINYPQAHMIYQHPHAGGQPSYPTCHQQQQHMLHHPSGLHYAQHISSHPHAVIHQQQQQQLHHHHIMHGGGGVGGGIGHHTHHHGGAVVIAGSGVGTGYGVSGGSTSPSSGMQQNLHKKNSIRGSGEVLKRSRAQTAYELSQDLLEKQIELLERKYGGVRARNAAITIQRAFRHYMMVKKFASITAMAKAEKRLSRRLMVVSSEGGASLSSAYGSATESQLDAQQQQQQLQHQVSSAASSTSLASSSSQQPRVTIMAGPPSGGAGAPTHVPSQSRTAPTRSLSMRERRQIDGSPIPRSQSGASSVSGASSSVSSSALTGSAHPHVNLLHAAESHYYSGVVSGGSPLPPGALYYPNYHGFQQHQQQQHDASFASSANSSHLDSSLNASWVGVGGSSPHTPYYSAAQIYMRPKAVVGGAMTPTDRKKVPPEVPKRTSSITAQQHAQHMAAAAAAAANQQHQHQLLIRQTPPPSASSMMRSNGLCKTAENGSLTSVQSSGSDSSVTSVERMAAANSDLGSDRSNSPNTWKRGTNLNSSQQYSHDSVSAGYGHGPNAMGGMGMGLASAVSVGGSSVGSGSLAGSGGVTASVSGPAGGDDHTVSSHTSAVQYEQHHTEHHEHTLDTSGASAASQNYKVSETIRKRQYRVGLNLFNKKPEKGITYLIRRGFLENTPQGVARFLISRKGLSRQMIGEYLGNLQNQFNMAVLNCFALELDLSGMQVDVALRKFQAYFRMPGEAQKIERLMEVFSHRYCQCNQDVVGRLRSSDTIFVLAFAIIMLNTDLHTPNLKPERRMRVEDFVKNLRGIDDCHDIDKDMLSGIYERVKANEFKPGSDHVTQVMKVQATIVGKKPNLALPHRRLVCYCRLYEIPDVNKKERPGVHQREVFLFNDLLVITKIFSKKKSSVTYTFRNSFPLCGMVVSLLDVPNYPFCIQLSQKVDGKILITFNARNEHDRCKFAEDLKESISEMDEMEALRIEAELERQKSARNRSATGNSENRDSGVADVEVCPCPYQPAQAGDHQMPNAIHNSDTASQQLKRSALSNSLLDMHEQFGNDKPQRRGSVGSLDSGMSISFQSTTTSSASRENAAAIAAAANAAAAKIRYAGLPPAAAAAAAAATIASTAGGGMMYTASATGGMHGYAAAAHPPTHPHYNLHPTQTQTILIQQQIGQQQQQQPQHQPQVHVPMQQQQQEPQQTVNVIHQQQPAPLTGRIPGRERKHSRSDENGRSTEV